MNRAAATRDQEARRQRREEYERSLAKRMTVRFYGSMPASIMVLDYRYWMLRRCGWDVLTQRWSIDDDGNATDAANSTIWKWWGRLGCDRRAELVYLSHHRLVQPRSLAN
jgi:hypothetical protein